MDLGYGNSNQQIGELASKVFLESSKKNEAEIDDELSHYDKLLNSTDSELDALRERRLAQMKKVQEQRQKWISMGHGKYTELCEGGGDTANEFFEASKKSKKMVIHFHRPATRSCDKFHAYLEKLAVKHLETRFIKISVDSVEEDGATGSGASYLVEKLGIVVMPTLIIVKDRKVEHHIRGFDELGGHEDFSIEALEYVLGLYGGINQSEGAEPPEELLTGNKGVNGVKIRTRYAGGRRGGVRDAEHDYGYGEDD